MAKIINTTDGKYIGHEVDISENPVYISDDLLLYYDKKIVSGDRVTLANSNYIINLEN
jgi:ribosome-associated protein YbcJ (S4-like RNA binding protein)